MTGEMERSDPERPQKETSAAGVQIMDDRINLFSSPVPVGRSRDRCV